MGLLLFFIGCGKNPIDSSNENLKETTAFVKFNGKIMIDGILYESGSKEMILPLKIPLSLKKIMAEYEYWVGGPNLTLYSGNTYEYIVNNYVIDNDQFIDWKSRSHLLTVGSPTSTTIKVSSYVEDEGWSTTSPQTNISCGNPPATEAFSSWGNYY